MNYVVRIGTRKETMAKDYVELTSCFREVKDDGRIAVIGTEDWPDANCLDCGTTVTWAEAGYVPGHRICPACGSHFDLYSDNGLWKLRRARFY